MNLDNDKKKNSSFQRQVIGVGIGGTMGMLGGMVGIGGGVIAIPMLTTFSKFTQHQATGTSLAAITSTGMLVRYTVFFYMSFIVFQVLWERQHII